MPSLFFKVFLTFYFPLSFQIAVDGIMKFCLRGLLGQQQRTTFFKFLDLIKLLCKDSITADDIPVLNEKVNVSLALLERDFPITVQVNAATYCVNFN